MKVEIRRAKASDKEPLMRFIRHIWGGHDYIPWVWDEWIADKSSALFVVEVDGVPVGMNRMRYMPDGSGWLEGVRIHPGYRGKGLASMLGRASMEVGSKKGVKIYRLTSHSRNWRAHRQVRKLGLREVSRLSVYEAPKGMRFGAVSGVRTVKPEEAKDAFDAMRNTREFQLGGGLYWDTFTASKLSAEIVAREAEAGDVLSLGSALALAKIGGEGSHQWRQVCFLCGEASDSMSLVRHVFGRRERVRAAWRIVYLPQGSKIIGALRAAGFRRAAPMVVYEGRAAKS